MVRSIELNARGGDGALRGGGDGALRGGAHPFPSLERDQGRHNVFSGVCKNDATHVEARINRIWAPVDRNLKRD